MTTTSDTSPLIAMLEWYRAMGADAVMSDQAIDWFAKGENEIVGGLPAGPDEPAVPANHPVQRETIVPATHGLARQQANRGQSVERVPHPAGVGSLSTGLGAGHEARNVARRAANLEELASALAGFDGCALKSTAKNLCFYRGAEKAPIMLIGEAPGRDEDLEGKPFVGRAGQLLNKMLGAIGVTEDNAHITNIVYWRPPGNRTPTPQEAEACRPFLERQLELVAPSVIVLLGGAAAKAILNDTEGIMRLRGRWRDVKIGAHTARAIATLHPAYLLRTPAAKRLAWRDLLAIKAAIDL